MIDKEAAVRLRKEVQRLYLERTGRPKFSVFALAKWSGVNREPLRNYLVNGKFPDPDVLASLAARLEVPTTQLWAKWLDLDSPDDGLTRIANELAGIQRVLKAAGRPQLAPDVRAAIDAAREDPPGEPVTDPPDGPDASAPPRTPVARTRRR